MTWWGVPFSLVTAYALFRLFEYAALKHYQVLMAEGILGNRKAQRLFGLVLLPARIAGWGLLVWVVMKLGVVGTLKMAFMAFVLSLVLQIPTMVALGSLGALGALTALAAVPISVAVVAFVIAAL